MHSVLQAKRLNVVTDESEQEFGGVMLELDLLEDSGQLMGTLGYNVDLFKESTVMKIAQQFQVCMGCPELSKNIKTNHLPARLTPSCWHILLCSAAPHSEWAIRNIGCVSEVMNRW